MFGFSFGAGPRVSGAPASPSVEPLAVSDFENDTYSIGGVSKTFADLWNSDGVWTLAAEGLVQELDMTAAGSESAEALLTASPELSAAVNPISLGCTAVIDIEQVADAGVYTLGELAFGAGSAGPTGYMEVSEGDNTTNRIGIGVAPTGRTTKATRPIGRHTLAISCNVDEISVSVDGSAPSTVAQQAGYASRLEGLNLYGYVWSWFAEATARSGKTTIKSVRLYEHQPSSALPGLSA